MATLIKLKHICKYYYQGDIVTKALDDINLDVREGEILVILGSSGGGKTTLLNVISGLDVPTSGKIIFDGIDISNYSDAKMTKFRKDKVGFIFQTYNLLAHLNVYENVKVGAQLGHNSKEDIMEIIKDVGLGDRAKSYMHQLSGGQQQRVSIARAIAKKPEVMFCDEPTGALDEETGKIVLRSLVNINAKYHTTMVIITHNPGIALIGDRIVRISSGKIISCERNNNKTEPEQIPWG